MTDWTTRGPVSGAGAIGDVGTPRGPVSGPGLDGNVAHPPRTTPARSWGWLVAVVLAIAATTALAWPSASLAARPADVARGLEDAPLYVDPVYADAVSAGERRELVRGLEALDRPTRLILAPLNPGDAADGRPGTLVELVLRRLQDAGEDPDGDYLVIDDAYVTAVTVRGGQEVQGGAAVRVAYLFNGRDTTAVNYRQPIGTTASQLVRELARPDEEVSADLARLRERQQRDAERRERVAGSGVPWVVVGVLVLAAVLGLVALLVRRRRRGASAVDAPLPLIPARVFEHARAARRAELREDADEQLLALADVLDREPVPDDEAAQEAYQEALDGMTGARRRLTPDAPTVDLVGVLVLVDRARRLLARAAALDAGRRPPAPEPLCTFHPLHGRAASTVDWRPDLRVPACAACAADLQAGRTPDALRDGDRPYFEADTVWARTGFGALSDDLLGRVSRGER